MYDASRLLAVLVLLGGCESAAPPMGLPDLSAFDEGVPAEADMAAGEDLLSPDLSASIRDLASQEDASLLPELGGMLDQLSLDLLTPDLWKPDLGCNTPTSCSDGTSCVTCAGNANGSDCTSPGSVQPCGCDAHGDCQSGRWCNVATCIPCSTGAAPCGTAQRCQGLCGAGRVCGAGNTCGN
jgi:hypothetical protein